MALAGAGGREQELVREPLEGGAARAASGFPRSAPLPLVRPDREAASRSRKGMPSLQLCQPSTKCPTAIPHDTIWMHRLRIFPTALEVSLLFKAILKQPCPIARGGGALLLDEGVDALHLRAADLERLRVAAAAHLPGAAPSDARIGRA